MFLYKKALIAVILFVSVVGLYAFEQTLSPQQDITVGDKVVLNIKAEGLTVDSLDKGNTSDHSLTIDVYNSKMQNYKNQKQVFAIANSHIFSFLLGIGLNQDFYKTYSFLTEYFDKNLDLKSLNAPDFIKLHLDK